MFKLAFYHQELRQDYTFCTFELFLINNGNRIGSKVGMFLINQNSFSSQALEMSPKNTVPTFLGVKDVKNDRHAFETSHTGDHGQN